MAKKPLIAVTGDYEAAKSRYYVNESYFHAVYLAGGIPVLLEAPMDVPEGWTGGMDDLQLPLYPQGVLERFDGLLITGGDDLVARFFGEDQALESDATNPLRDAFELQLCREAKQLRLPTFGICRGHQVMGVSDGMGLNQDVYRFAGATLQHGQHASSWFPTHEVTVRPDSRLGKILGERAFVNSFHHQSLRLPEAYPGPLCVSAWSPDGLVEGIEDPSLPFHLAVQWHPERMVKNPLQLALFQAHVAAAEAYAAARPDA